MVQEFALTRKKMCVKTDNDEILYLRCKGKCINLNHALITAFIFN